MRLGIRPLAFFVRLLVAFAVTYALWAPLAASYTRLLAALTQGFLYLIETSSDPDLHRVTVMRVQETAIFFSHRLFPQVHPPGIPAEWVQANLVLLIPLMLATPAPTYRTKVWRLALALSIALLLQVLDLAMTVKSFYARNLGTYSLYYYSSAARFVYGFADAFNQAMDTQLFPVVIWAGIHFNQLLGRTTKPAPGPLVRSPPVTVAAQSREKRRRRKGGKTAGAR
jgi:hypothetical protein